MDKRQFQVLLDKCLKGKCSEEEEHMLSEFYEYFQKDIRWDATKLGHKDRVEAELAEGIDKRIWKAEFNSKDKSRYAIRYFLQTAAVLFLAAIIGYLGWFYYQKKPLHNAALALIEKVTQKGQKSTLILSDGTQIRLNSESRISFPETFGSNSREVFLEGEAFFDVARNEKKPFIIKTGDLSTKVLGTSFNVKAYPQEEISITVATGKVQVSAVNRDPALVEGHTQENGQHDDNSIPNTQYAVLLTPNQQATFNPVSGALEKKEVNITNDLAWKEGTIRFEDIQLQEAVIILERWYGVEITFENENTGHCRIASGEFTNENLFNILQSFQYFLEIEFEVVDGENITISGKGCQSEH